MAPSNFLKRKLLKTPEKENLTTEVSNELPPIPEAEVGPVYTETGFDIFTDDGGAHYKVAEIVYNPVTKQAEVKEIFTITRLVALQYRNTKTALGTLKKRIVKE